MLPGRNLHRCLILAMLLTAGGGDNRSLAADTEFLACRRNLTLIGEAVADYRQGHDGQFPPELGDLFRGGYVSEGTVLRCPTAVKSGLPGPVNPELVRPGERDGLVVGYTWEMSWDDPSFWEGLGFSVRFHDFKQLQLRSLVGEHVPILRCSHHGQEGADKVLNLTANGRVYESGEYWEEKFVDVLPGARLSPEMVHTAHLPMSKLVRPRSELATVAMLDLRKHYNARFEDPWIQADLGQELTSFVKSLEEGTMVSSGIRFEPVGIVQLSGKLVSKVAKGTGYSRYEYPTKIAPIAIQRRVRTVHVLGGVAFKSPMNTVVARLEFLRTDGHRSTTWEWRYGVDVADIIYPETEVFVETEGARVAWTGDFRLGPATGTRARVVHLKFSMPEPEIPVEQLRFSPGDGPSCPLIAAITLEEP